MLNLVRLKKDSKGLALISVMGLMSILFLLGTAAMTITSTEKKVSHNYMQSVQAFYDCEAGIAEAMAKINNNTATLNQWRQASDSSSFEYRYYISYDSNEEIYEVTSEGKDPSQSSNRKIIAEFEKSVSPGDITSPVYCGTGDNNGQPNRIYGDSSCPSWVDDGDPNNDTSAPCVATPQPYITDRDPLGFDPNQLITSNPDKMAYNVPELDLVEMAHYYRDYPPDLTSIPTGCTTTIGAPDDLQVVYIDGSQTISGHKTGFGVLVVTGDLHLSGQLQWFGIVIVLGNLRQTGGGCHGIQVTGAVMTENEFSIRGNPDVQWCGDLIRHVFDELGSPPLSVLSWMEE